MKHELIGQFSISGSESTKFAALSGDYNPLHVDPVYSRRLQFGKPVIHGVHHLLRTLEAVFAEETDNPGRSLVRVSATFSRPVSVDQLIDYQCNFSSDHSQANITAKSNGQKILSLKLEVSRDIDHGMDVFFITEEPPRGTPIEQTFPPPYVDGSCELCLVPTLCHELFPTLLSSLPGYQLAEILTCTRVVGMKAPGLHSIFSRINLEFDSVFFPEVGRHLHYFEIHKDKRVKMLKLGVEAPGMKGTLDTFFRPIPVAQPDFKDVCRRVPDGIFDDQRALIIGGSRGVGETTAKILAAGGAEVTITFSRGLSDAQRIKREIDIGPGSCDILELDVTASPEYHDMVLGSQMLPTHIYYFASPRIQANQVQVWDKGLFAEFSRFYLSGFAEIVRRYGDLAKLAKTPITVFYPSSVFLDEPVKGFVEYTVSKAAGETLCRELGLKYPHVEFITPRLPRMSTDQTLSIIPLECNGVFDVMFKVLKNMGDVS